VWILGVVLVVSVIALLSKRTSVFLGGAIGSLLGFVAPQPKTEAMCSSAEAAYLLAINDYVLHAVTWGVLGAIAGVGIAVVVGRTIALKKLGRPHKTASHRCSWFKIRTIDAANG
jgi:hypothetical protein